MDKIGKKLKSIVKDHNGSLTITQSADKVLVYSNDKECRDEVENLARSANLQSIRKDTTHYYQGREFPASVLIGKNLRGEVEATDLDEALGL